MKLSNSVSRAIRTFAYFMASGTHAQLAGVDYRELWDEPSALEMAFAIFVNVLETDEHGIVLNARYATLRATQYIREYLDGAGTYRAEPPLEDWEMALH